MTQSNNVVNILVVNTGSTSIKLDAVEVRNDTLSPIHTERHQTNEHDVDALLKRFLAGVARIDAVVHRVVNGGSDFIESRVINEQTENSIEALNELAPLHNPVALRWIRACRRQLHAMQVAVFDTAFFATMPPVAKSYAIPPGVAAQFGIRRYGFHGIAHRSMWQRWCELHPDLQDGGKLITIQLGGGCSITANKHGIPMDTSMGFSPAEGLVMATRCGDIDPGAIVHLIRNKGISPEMAAQLINTQSGLLGISGISDDMRDLIDNPDRQARFAIEIFCYRLRKYIGAYLTVLGGADGIVFGGGIGENIAQVRTGTLKDMQWCGIDIDIELNKQACGIESRISTSDSSIDVRVVPVNETAILADEARRIMENIQGVSP